MIIEKTFYGCKCDNCGDSWEDNDIGFYDDPSFTIDSILQSDWHEGENDKHYCPDCFTVGENDELIILTPNP